MRSLLEQGFRDKPIPVKGTFIVFTIPFLLALFTTVYIEIIFLSLT